MLILLSQANRKKKTQIQANILSCKIYLYLTSITPNWTKYYSFAGGGGSKYNNQNRSAGKKRYQNYTDVSSFINGRHLYKKKTTTKNNNIVDRVDRYLYGELYKLHKQAHTHIYAQRNLIAFYQQRKKNGK